MNEEKLEAEAEAKRHMRRNQHVAVHFVAVAAATIKTPVLSRFISFNYTMLLDEDPATVCAYFTTNE